MNFTDKILLASTDDVKNFLEISSADFDGLIKLILSSVSNKIETFLNRYLLKKERTEYFNNYRNKIYLSAYPIDASKRIVVKDDDEELVINDDFFVWEDSGIVELTYLLPASRPKQIEITYTGGFDSIGTVSIRNKVYDIIDVPDAIVMATVRQASFEFLRRKEIGISSFSSHDGSVNLANVDLLPDVKNVLLFFRRKPSDR